MATSKRSCGYAKGFGVTSPRTSSPSRGPAFLDNDSQVPFHIENNSRGFPSDQRQLDLPSPEPCSELIAAEDHATVCVDGVWIPREEVIRRVYEPIRSGMRQATERATEKSARLGFMERIRSDRRVAMDRVRRRAARGEIGDACESVAEW